MNRTAFLQWADDVVEDCRQYHSKCKRYHTNERKRGGGWQLRAEVAVIPNSSDTRVCSIFLCTCTWWTPDRGGGGLAFVSQPPAKPFTQNVNTWKDFGLAELEGGDPERTRPSVKWCLPVTFERTLKISTFVTDSAAVLLLQRASCAEYLAFGLYNRYGPVMSNSWWITTSTCLTHQEIGQTNPFYLGDKPTRTPRRERSACYASYSISSNLSSTLWT